MRKVILFLKNIETYSKRFQAKEIAKNTATTKYNILLMSNYFGIVINKIKINKPLALDRLLDSSHWN